MMTFPCPLFQWLWQLYSQRRATMGSTLAALNAGRKVANTVTAISHGQYLAGARAERHANANFAVPFRNGAGD
jgi:hypothetical protein